MVRSELEDKRAGLLGLLAEDGSELVGEVHCDIKM